MIGFFGIVAPKQLWNDTLEHAVNEGIEFLQGHSPVTPIFCKGETNSLFYRLAILSSPENVYLSSESAKNIIVSQGVYKDKTPLENFSSGNIDVYKLLENLNGHFNLFAHSKDKNELVFARDRGGAKPFFYFSNERVFLISSGIRAIAKHSLYTDKGINKEALWSNLAYPAPIQPLTAFNKIHALERGGYIKLLKSQNPELEKFWSIPSLNINETLSLEESAQKVHSSINAAVKWQVSQKKQIGSTLSGGVDSTYLTSLGYEHNSNLEAFTYKLADPRLHHLNEDVVASMVAKAKDIPHHTIAFDFEDFIADFDLVVELYEQPGHSLGVYYSILKAAHKLNYKSVLNGLAADELYGGFHFFKHLEYWKYLRLFNPFSGLLPDNTHAGIDKLKKISKSKDINEYYARAAGIFNDKELNRLFKHGFKSSIIELQKRAYNPEDITFKDHTSGLMHYMFSNCPNHHLYRFTTAAHYFGIEPLYPFLDNDVIETAFSIPSKWKVQGHKRKIVLKKVALPYSVKEAMTEAKKGVGAPVTDWINNKLSSRKEAALQKLAKRDLFDEDYLEQVVKKYPSKYGKKVWKLVMIELWLEKFIDDSMHHSK